MDINVIKVDPDTRVVSFKFNLVPRRTRGIEGLLQLVAKTILTTPGTDIWSPQYGGGLRSYQANGVHSGNKNIVNSDIASIVRKSEEQIKSVQSTLTLNPDERLESLKILSIKWLSDNISIIIRILVTAASGSSADIRLPNQLATSIEEQNFLEEKPIPESIYNSK